jgi:hypothetical protein
MIIDYLKKHPKVNNIEFNDAPVFVIGFPRTGTTVLHELLGLHQDVKMHYTYEQIASVPTTNENSIEAFEIDRKKRYDNEKAF